MRPKSPVMKSRSPVGRGMSNSSQNSQNISVIVGEGKLSPKVNGVSESISNTQNTSAHPSTITNTLPIPQCALRIHGKSPRPIRYNIPTTNHSIYIYIYILCVERIGTPKDKQDMSMKNKGASSHLIGETNQDNPLKSCLHLDRAPSRGLSGDAVKMKSKKGVINDHTDQALRSSSPGRSMGGLYLNSHMAKTLYFPNVQPFRDTNQVHIYIYIYIYMLG